LPVGTRVGTTFIVLYTDPESHKAYTALQTDRQTDDIMMSNANYSRSHCVAVRSAKTSKACFYLKKQKTF